MKVSEMLQEAVKFDVTLLAHSIYYAVQKKVILLTDDYSIDFIDLLTENDHLIIKNMIADDYLKLRLIKLLAVPLNNKEFAFYLTKKTEDIAKIHFKNFKKQPTKIIDAHRMFDKSLYFQDSKKTMTFRDISKKTADYPTLVCILESG